MAFIIMFSHMLHLSFLPNLIGGILTSGSQSSLTPCHLPLHEHIGISPSSATNHLSSDTELPFLLLSEIPTHLYFCQHPLLFPAMPHLLVGHRSTTITIPTKPIANVNFKSHDLEKKVAISRPRKLDR